jgi:hypothetical protein
VVRRHSIDKPSAVPRTKEDLSDFKLTSILRVHSEESSDDEEIKKAPVKKVNFWTGK